jgi:hypothetical protein
MTRTEDRLADALHTAARSVREETMRPLRVPTPARRLWPRRLAPVAAAACVALVIVVVTVIVPSTGRAPSGQAAGPPPFYVVSAGLRLQVRSTATGAVTGIVPAPLFGSGASRQPMVPGAVTSVGSSGREFIVAFMSPGPYQTRLYSFRLTGEGHVTDVSLIRGGTLDGVMLFYNYDIAASPDGSKLVLAGCKYSPSGSSCREEVVVIDLRTGTHAQWTGGLGSGTRGFSILDVGWAPSGDSVTFLATHCFTILGQCSTAAMVPQPQLRKISLSSGGGSLAKSSVLFTGPARNPVLSQAQLSNDGRAVVFMDNYGPFRNGVAKSIRVFQVPIAGGQPRLLYEGSSIVQSPVGLRLSSSGQYLLLSGNRAAWVYHGKLHVVPGKTFADVWW